jgi:hypothetical protein
MARIHGILLEKVAREQGKSWRGTNGEYLIRDMAAPQPKLMPTEVLRRLERRLVKRIATRLPQAGEEVFSGMTP